MVDYPIAGGVFLEAFGRMSDSLLLPFKAHSQQARSLEIMELIRAVEAEGKDTILLDGEEVPIAAVQVVEQPKKQSKIKYTCLKCGDNVWGKPGLLVACAGCMGEYFELDKGIRLQHSHLEEFIMVAVG